MPEARLIPVDGGQIPDFRTEDVEETAILQRHSRNLSVRFDLDTLDRLRKVAKQKGVGYQTLLKQCVTERLYEEEKREGLIGDRA